MKKLKGTTIIHCSAQAYALVLLIEKDAARRGVDPLALAERHAAEMPDDQRATCADLVREVCGLITARQSCERIRFKFDDEVTEEKGGKQ